MTPGAECTLCRTRRSRRSRPPASVSLRRALRLRGEVDESLRTRAAAVEDLLARTSHTAWSAARRAGGYFQIGQTTGRSAGPVRRSLPVDERTIRVAAEQPMALRDTLVRAHGGIAVVPFGAAALQIRPLTEVDDVLGRRAGSSWGHRSQAAAWRPALAARRASALVPTSQADGGRRGHYRGAGLSPPMTRTAGRARTWRSLQRDAGGARRLSGGTAPAGLDASHELRTPLTSLRTNVETLGKATRAAGGRAPPAADDVDAELDELCD
jgi:signal transduction histidine kinase